MKNFIAAQAPMKHTEVDVWGMICAEKCTTVVVLCNFTEENVVSIQRLANLDH